MAHLADNPAFDGVEMLGVGLFGGGQIHHGSKPVITPEDMANQKVRIGGPIQAQIMEALKQHTIVPNGLYDSSFFIVINEAKWASLEEADRAAIAAISGEALSRVWGQQFNAQHEKAMALFSEGGHTFNEPSAALMDAITAVSDKMIADWVVAAKAVGVADPAAMRADYLAAYAELSAK